MKMMNSQKMSNMGMKNGKPAGKMMKKAKMKKGMKMMKMKKGGKC